MYRGAATNGYPVLYDIFYLVQYLLDIKGKFIPPVNCRSLIKQNGNYQQAYFRHSQGAWNKIMTHFTKILIITALARNNGCTNFNRWGIFVSKKFKFELLFTWSLIFYRQKPKLNNFRVFEELVFFDLSIPV